MKMHPEIFGSSRKDRMIRRLRTLAIGLVSAAFLPASFALGDPKVDISDAGPATAVGCSISPKGMHVAVLAQTGSRYTLYMDGTAGPRMEQMDWTGGAGFNAGSPGGWVGAIPVLWTPDGAHWTYC
jgi:hypothetical protein